MLNDNLNAIDKWLAQNANKIATLSLRKPASMKEIEELENAVGKSLPEDFKQLYAWHDGLDNQENMANLFYGMDFVPIEFVQKHHFQQNGVSSDEPMPLERADKEIKTENLSNPNWVKFASDGGRTGFYLDLDPTEFGHYGQIIFIDLDYQMGILVANSTEQLIKDFLQDLQNGEYFLNEEALEDDNHFLELAQEIDIVNWFKSTKWKR